MELLQVNGVHRGLLIPVVRHMANTLSPATVLETISMFFTKLITFLYSVIGTRDTNTVLLSRIDHVLQAWKFGLKCVYTSKYCK
jgi:hypothetical protein